MPPLEQIQQIGLDFEGVEVATQSYVQALISEAEALDHIEFRHCSPAVRSWPPSRPSSTSVS